MRWGQPSIAPEKLLRALLQILYTIRSGGQVVEQLEVQPPGSRKGESRTPTALGSGQPPRK